MDELLQQVLAQAPDALVVADQAGIIRYWNLGAEAIFGHAAIAALGQSLNLIIPESLRDRHWAGYHRVMATGLTQYASRLLTSPGMRRDGSRVSLEFSVILVRGADGTMQGCASILRDVSERWQREQELRRRLAECEGRLSA